ncbi:MAG: hypothetical protein AABX47_05325 [Nanoarchaeota archaeon]
MSSIMIILIKDRGISFRSLHYRHVISILSSSCVGIEGIVQDTCPDRFLDAGYILIDLDRKRIVSGQDAFSIHHLPKRERLTLAQRFELVV